MSEKKISRRFTAGEHHVKEVLQSTEGQTRASALHFLESQRWVEQSSRLVSEDIFQRDTPEAYFKLLAEGEAKRLGTVAQKQGAGFVVSMKADEAKAFFKENGMSLQQVNKQQRER